MHTHPHTQRAEHMGIPRFHRRGYWKRFLTKLLINKNINITSLSYSRLPLSPLLFLSVLTSLLFPLITTSHIFFCISPPSVYTPSSVPYTHKHTHTHIAAVTLFFLFLKAVASHQADTDQGRDSYSVILTSSTKLLGWSVRAVHR